MFDDLKDEILKCRMCQEEFGFEPHPIIFGNANSKIMQISQAPSQNVHETLKPFNDHSGRKLRNRWYCIDDEVFYNQDNFYITAVAHCYPGKSKNGGDRLPPKSCARRWLRREMEIVNNRIYIIIGMKSASLLFPDQDYNGLIFNDNEINGKPAFVLPHPSPLNVRWFKENPLFLEVRIHRIKEVIHEVLYS
jgi:uracil-DNA glycosylase family 4